MYFIQVFVNDSSSISFWVVSLLSPTGVALAMDKVCIQFTKFCIINIGISILKGNKISRNSTNKTSFTCYKLAPFFQALVLDLQGEGVNFDNLWSGPGIPFGGSLIMMTLDIFLYACLAYYFDSVIPSTFLKTIFVVRCIP